jgi:bla regulator protein blaR1
MSLEALRALADHLWQSSACAGIVLLVTIGLRKNRAAVRYWLWFAASVKFLIPFSLLMSLGAHIGWRSAPHGERLNWPFTIECLSHPFAAAASVPYALPQTTAACSALPTILTAIWAVGFAASILHWFCCWRQARETARTGKPVPFCLPVPAVWSTRRLEPGVVGIWRPVLVLPKGLSDHLTAAQLEMILAHEIAHVRRHDNLTAAIHMLVECVFWFYPLVWWIRRQLLDERERACDEHVLQLGNDPESYADTIIRVCKFFVPSQLLCASGITGANLKTRIERIMANSAGCAVTGTNKLLLGVIIGAVLLGPLALGALSERPASQSDSAVGSTRLSFDVASIRPSGPNSQFGGWFGPGSHVILSHVSLDRLIKWSYALRDGQLLGGPDWLHKKFFDIDAKCDPPAGGDPRTMNSERRHAYEHQIFLRLQSLMADRFQLRLRQETRELHVYELVAGSKGPKFNETPKPGLDGKIKEGSILRPGHMELYHAPTDIVVRILSQVSGQIVLDRTGLKGFYDLTLDWTPEVPRSPDSHSGEASDVSGPTLFTAVQEQLGLKLKPAKDPVPVLVVENVSLPERN